MSVCLLTSPRRRCGPQFACSEKSPYLRQYTEALDRRIAYMRGEDRRALKGLLYGAPFVLEDGRVMK